jgi:hypothetical protein
MDCGPPFLFLFSLDFAVYVYVIMYGGFRMVVLRTWDVVVLIC